MTIKHITFAAIITSNTTQIIISFLLINTYKTMKKNLNMLTAAFVAAVAAVPAVASEEPVTLYGFMTYSQSGHSNGIHSLKAEDGAQPELFMADGDMLSNGGAVYADGKCYVLSYMDFFGSMMWWYQVYDLDTEEMTMVSDAAWGVKDAGSAMTYDPSTGNVYSICIDAADNDKFTLSTMDLLDGTKTPVAGIDERMCAMAATASGVLYGIGMDGNLYTIDKFTAGRTLVGPTGVKPESNQSAVVDWKTGVMYWSAYTADGGALYTVDTGTGQATLLSTYDDKQQLVGLFIRQTAVADGAPSSVDGFSVEFDKATTAGTAAFTMPTLDINGETLANELSYGVRLDEETLAEGIAQPGDRVEEGIVSPRTGNCRFTVYVSNATGEGKPESINVWVGPDTPLKVEDLSLAEDGGDLSLSWKLPARGVNGGYVDPELTRYRIVRGPYEDMTVEDFEGTEFREAYDSGGVNPHMYTVTPVYDGRTGETALSNTVITGRYCEPPFSEDLTDPFRSLVFTAVDSNQDECTWLYDWDEKAMKCEWPISPSSDDWLISAPILFQADKTYVVSLGIRSEGKWNYDDEVYEDVYAGTLSMFLGDKAETDAMTEEIIKPYDVEKTEWHSLSSDRFSVPATGVYHIGLHHSGTRSIYYTYLRSLDISVHSGVESVEAEYDGCEVEYYDLQGIRISAPAKGSIVIVRKGGRSSLIRVN
jgi:hypothetical protein